MKLDKPAALDKSGRLAELGAIARLSNFGRGVAKSSSFGIRVNVKSGGFVHLHTNVTGI